MALKNKDGTPYRLAGPNPVMKTQSFWGDFQLHNMKWSGEKYLDTLSRNIEKSPKSFVEELEETKGDIQIVVPGVKSMEAPAEQPEEAEIVERRPEVRRDASRDEARDQSSVDKVFIHCLPAIVRMKRDELYGDVYKKVTYGDPFSFEGVVISEDDMSLQFWTTVDVKDESIVYPKINSKRWWRVLSSEKKAAGVLYLTVPSDKQPSFSVSD